MPTENRSVNTEMVSVPRDLLARVSSTELGMSARKYRYAAASEARAILAQPALQPHPDPIAWMVGTAFWWTKEEAERDAAETGLPIVGLGPTANTAEVERLRAACEAEFRSVEVLNEANQKLQAQLAEAQALLKHREEMLAKVAGGWPLRIYTKDDPLLIKTCGEAMAYSVDGGMMTTFDPEKMELSASAEPSAWQSQREPVGVAVPELQFKSYPGEEGWTYCTFRADVVPAGTKLFTLESMGTEPSEPVEIDERAELEAYCTKVGLPLDRLPSGEYMIPATRFVSQGWHAHAASSRKQ